MGKRYYCDYCDKTMSCMPSIIKTHNSGLMHQRAKQEHFQNFKDPETILAEEEKKRPCARFPSGNCQFGSICRYSHYSPEAIQLLHKYVESKRITNSIGTQPSFQDLYNKFQTENTITNEGAGTVLVDPNGVTHHLPWSYNTALDNIADLPPSIKRIKVDNFNNIKFNEWG